MIPGPTYFYHCPGCSNVIANDSIASGNTYGSSLYTDARRIAPMLPEFPIITKCQVCNTFLWLDIAEPFTSSHDSGNELYKSAQKAEFLSIEDYFSALAIEVSGDSDERYIRTRIWWTFNDRIRKNDPLFQDPTDEQRWTGNCNKLIDLLDPADMIQRLNIAELNRNLGRFNECLTLLDGVDEEYQWVAEKIREECNAGRTAVAKF